MTQTALAARTHGWFAKIWHDLVDRNTTRKTFMKRYKRKEPKKQTLYVCDMCENPIPKSGPDPKSYMGFIVIGNIHVAEEGAGGVVGDNFPEDDAASEEARKFYLDEVGKSCLCRTCLGRILGFIPSPLEEIPF